MLPFSVVSKLHTVTVFSFAVIFMAATFGFDVPILGPRTLLLDWDPENASLVFVTRFLALLMVAVGSYEWIFAEDIRLKTPFTAYHVILSVVIIYTSLEAANGLLGWIPAVVITTFTILGAVAKSSGYTAI